MPSPNPELSTEATRDTAAITDRALTDYYTALVSRQLSTVIRRDVLSGRAKFGVSDDGKELYQLAIARVIRAGDWRADYYRGHTLLLSLGLATVEDILAQLYADGENDPFSRGRQMVGHYATSTIDQNGDWLDHTKSINISSATSPTAGQMARGLGLAFASKMYRGGQNLPQGFSENGDEICWTEIGDASTSEGVFWETLNAAGVLQVPMVATVVDDGFGISVPVEKQTTKASISKATAGFQANQDGPGIDIYNVKGWDYPALLEVYAKAAATARKDHRAALVHVDELTQPNGHSTSGSHERYKTKERLDWEKEWDCLAQFRHWILATGLCEAEHLAALEKKAKKEVMAARKNAWDRYTGRLQLTRDQVMALLPEADYPAEAFAEFRRTVAREELPIVTLLIDAARTLRFIVGADQLPEPFLAWMRNARRDVKTYFGDNLLSDTANSPVRVTAEPAVYGENPKTLPAYELLQHYFSAKFAEIPELFAFGEDVGKIGDVNQGLAGLQAEFGEARVFDTGIREWTIVGQAMGMAMRGLRPIAEIQYLDYIYYALPMLTDDIATLRWRTAGLQSCPLIIRTRGHRLEGIWHSGSYLAALTSSLRGIHLCVPRNAVQAAGMYNTLLRGDDPAIVIEVLNGYRLHEAEPDNLADFTVPLGVPECLRAGTDVTLVTYGACVKISLEAAELLAKRGISVEVIDVQTLLPFDLEHRIANHLSKTNRLLIVDEDAPGATSAYIRHQVLEVQGGYFHLDASIKSLTASEHRPAYGDDGNYVSKPQIMDVVEAVLELVAE
ncbi:alpha-ketoacid dehydrogenase subunit alpha/beta [Neolewinella antarctica]|uniref:3-methyl-2-oxobutanoate dehydrogenase (2-methylpropanoyl-transferring) n=1 Tax=Neolewinella antarctica TaxID=442734 RepID=A0ABX0XF14_9BACT|nr:alpha-ketoacid dehydrogenase subunit alpha/beta [Neolewinella antarctica]NJC27807.1 pyruvate/2-oxoglutarate/acetoin dehydrogenase E1 component/TPP-dependent pyruvate/acetoin dehydrogenase alpha subunit [Neolewinella antarctica]